MKLYIRADITDITEESDSVRWETADNPRTRPTTLARLAHDPFENVRVCVASNPNTPEKILKEMVDDDYSVVRSLLSNPKLPADCIKSIYQDTSLYDVWTGWARDSLLEHIAMHPNTPVYILQDLCDPAVAKADIRYAIASNLNTPAEALTRLRDDISCSVRERVR